MKVVLANPRGFCAGVDRAIEIVERALARTDEPVYVRHEIVHNRRVVDDLHATVNKANEELDRVDDVIGRAERITATVDVASRLTYKAMAPPLIKTLSFVKGASRAGRALRTPRRRKAIEVRGRQK